MSTFFFLKQCITCIIDKRKWTKGGEGRSSQEPEGWS